MLQCSVPPAPAMTSFVVTSADGERFIGVAVNFYEPTSTPLGRAARTPNNHDNGSDGDSDSDSSPQRAIALSPTCGPPASWFAAKAIVLLTKWCVCSMRHWQLWVRSWWLWFVDIIAGVAVCTTIYVSRPFVLTLSRWLCELYRQRVFGQRVTQAYLCNLLFEVQTPPRSRTRVPFSIGEVKTHTTTMACAHSVLAAT